MEIPLDEVVHFDAIASSSTGAAVDADSTPTFAVYEEATDTDIGVGGNMTKRTSLTGNYRLTFTVSAANGFEVGKWYNVIGSATIGGIATKGVIKTFLVKAVDTPQTGDAYAVVNNVTFGNNSLYTLLNMIGGFVDTEVAAIKAKTDLIPASPAAVGSAMTLTSGERDAIAEAVFKLDLSTLTGEASRSLLNAIRKLRNKWSISGTTLTVYKEDDSTTAYTQDLTATAGADPITGIDN